MNYTKGNWEAQQQKNLASGKYEWVIKVKEDDVKSRVIATTPYANKYNDHEANAHLIEAAPAMYQKLLKIRKWLVMLAERCEAETKNVARFKTLQDAYIRDAKNLRTTIADIDTVLNKVEGK
jgi:hypothetical protein